MTIWDWSYAWEVMPELVGGLWVTIQVSVFAGAFAVVGGLTLVLGLRSGPRLMRFALRTVLEFIRGTPLLVQIYFVFFVLPAYGVTLSAFRAGVFAIGVHYAAYCAEAYRGGIDSVAQQQWEAAAALNLSQLRTWRAVILPQAIRNAVPSLANYLLIIYKETALLFVIGVPVLIQVARAEGTTTFRYLEPLTMAGLLYGAVSYPSALVLRRLERRRERS